MNENKALREHLVKLLAGRQAHLSWEDGLHDFPRELQGAKPTGAAHTPWQLLEHMRLAQWDILEFSRNPKHVSPEFPQGYWPKTETPPDAAAWDKSLEGFASDLEAMKALVNDPSTDLFAPVAGGTGQTVLREAMLTADHNAYHLGQIVQLRKMMTSKE